MTMFGSPKTRDDDEREKELRDGISPQNWL